ncbi:VOC family protein [Parasphingorhabdus sp.]|uniref:VOC family protein n=1 Tax=Parasphingorhabdus sp. TaxID=2709688 RepID=UPI0030B2B001|nr:VOC family protein [Sphingomonadales bacterium]
MIKGVHHIAIGVPDIEAGLLFYCDTLGFDLDWRRDISADNEKAGAAVGLPGFEAKMAMLKGSNLCLELWQYSNPEPRDLRSDPSDLGYPHMALAVEDIEAEYIRLTAAGMTFVGPPADFGTQKAIYGRDPFGNIIELLEEI